MYLFLICINIVKFWETVYFQVSAGICTHFDNSSYSISRCSFWQSKPI